MPPSTETLASRSIVSDAVSADQGKAVGAAGVNGRKPGARRRLRHLAIEDLWPRLTIEPSARSARLGSRPAAMAVNPVPDGVCDHQAVIILTQLTMGAVGTERKAVIVAVSNGPVPVPAGG